MDNILDSLSRHLASNTIELRRNQGLSQSQLAKKAGIPRSTLTYIESGQSNPSLQNLAKLSRALQISVEELLSEPQASVKLIKASDIPVQIKNQVQVEKLLPDPIPGMEIDRMTLEPKGRMKGTPHIERTKEYLYCASGRINLYVSGKKYELSAGDLMAFPGDGPHAYENPDSRKKATCFSVVVFAPTGI